MGQKVHPTAFRLGVLYTPKSKWFAKHNFSILLKEDVCIRKFLKRKLREAGVGSIEIERSAHTINIIIHSSRPGVIIGRGGAEVELLKKEVHDTFLGNQKITVNITIQEIQKPDIDAQLICRALVEQVEKRMSVRQIMKRAIQQVKKAGGKGVRVTLSGRLNGAEIARRETLSFGKLPLQTIRADIDYARDAAYTTYGTVGVKVWIYKGEVFV
ncbi:MAG: 30S ribosomal protein S3 [Candidatus Kerfeldbacteria bacterium RIFCSPHIGHO2_02_FULL_42_14]|uniref:Small ribosomal subunit protein uS3 n=1 Tax=Candidatus Kerfeldbacteria bacterium RIFCSPHIGHO2_02_FULL_42_14 TaxID=1798540 RepID=A0A1G2ASW7_9BACT|nr:MAG: 30S ribosomal protein S3 [Candidatus Kerfeldbacteria bacterium RIFCSPHIGHO2_02_FULL_42_14]OGY80421.1 MAG: 30S ribosomal protein S3 [Candidatus Kerfeldbacteria bacterium RIFCSPHIGHO2_12_FULL_42_13]OGY83851.1 MAG: 30S ribosomal protein S3 [Candidatus Kerfeldbacteria bacterium RIFCSPLOWO2_02_FULL_42_19]OGY85303.1 MAG: 30S ribosomal protein S3 [Candidatus Kerfeldbacteria bacterium RIFCSPLOWO2_12_FULL_43_9]